MAAVTGSLTAGQHEVTAADHSACAHFLADRSILAFLTIFTSISFASLSCETSYLSCKMKSWYLWPLAVAAVLESVGFISSIYYSQHQTSHVVYFVGFAGMSLAPSMVAIAAIVTFGRIVSWTIPMERRNTRNIGISFETVTPIFVTLEALALSCIAFGVYSIGKFLSPAKIHCHHEALQRLVHYERGLTALKVGQIVEVVSLTLFGLVAICYLIANFGGGDMTVSTKGNDAKKLSIMVLAVCGLITIRSTYKMAAYSGPLSTYDHLAVHDQWFWLLDALPVLLAIFSFCARHPANFLPQEYTSLWLEKSVALPVADSEKCKYMIR